MPPFTRGCKVVFQVACCRSTMTFAFSGNGTWLSSRHLVYLHSTATCPKHPKGRSPNHTRILHQCISSKGNNDLQVFRCELAVHRELSLLINKGLGWLLLIEKLGGAPLSIDMGKWVIGGYQSLRNQVVSILTVILYSVGITSVTVSNVEQTGAVDNVTFLFFRCQCVPEHRELHDFQRWLW